MKAGWRIFSLGMALTFAIAVQPSAWALNSPGGQEAEHRDQHATQEHSNYSNNSFYQMGNREGYQDYQKHTQRKAHNHKYRNDEDRRAHDEGYQQGWQGHEYHNDTDRPH